jgi:hypothetical protein
MDQWGLPVGLVRVLVVDAERDGGVGLARRRGMITLRAPGSRSWAASTRLVNRPIDSITTSTPRSSHGSCARPLSAKTFTSRAVDGDRAVARLHGARERPQHRDVLEQMRQRRSARDVVDGDDLDVDVPYVVGAEHVPADATNPLIPTRTD